MHAERTALVLVSDGLDHRAEDVGVSDVEEVRPCDSAESGYVRRFREQSSIHVGECVRPPANARLLPGFGLRVHRAEDLADHLVSVRAVAFAHPSDRVCEQVGSPEDVGVFGEEAEDEPRHEVVHLVLAACGAPLGVVLEQRDVESVQPSGRLDVDRALADLLDGRDPSERQEEPEVVGEVLVVAGNRLAGVEVFGLELRAVRCEDELRFRARRRTAGPERCERGVRLAFGAHLDVDVPVLEYSLEVGIVRRARAQPLDCGGLVAECLQE